MILVDSLVASRITGGNTSYKRVQSDFYPTPVEVTQALLNFLKLPEGTVIWEPACGENHMVNVMEGNGLRVIGTDIAAGMDYLTAERLDCDWIITNPPFTLADRFVQRSIEHEKPFAMLLKSQYWHARKRLELFRSYPPSAVCPLTWRPDFLFKERGRGAPLMDVCWVIWDGNHDTRYIPLEKPMKGGDIR